MLGTGFQPRRKKEVINGPLISAISGNEDSKNKSGNRASVIPSLNDPIQGQSSKDLFFQDGLLGQKKVNSNIAAGNGPLISAIPINKEAANDQIHVQSSKEIIFQDGLLGQKKVNANITAGNGPLITAIPINKEEVKAPHTLDQGLLGQMQSREAYIKSKMGVKGTFSARQSTINPSNTAANQNAYQTYYGYPNPTYNAQNYLTPQSLNNNILQQAYNYPPTQYSNQGVNSPLSAGYVGPVGYMPIEYQQALMYQQYMYALETQNKSKEKKKKKKSKKKDKKTKKKESNTPVMPFQMMQYPPGYLVSAYPESTGQGPSGSIVSRIESSSEESEESEIS